MKVTILGCGGAGGVPSLGAGWGKCNPSEPRNRRTRASILVEEGDTRILVDTSPDMREQLLRANTNHLNAVVYTHAHADHMHGIDDLREINRAMGCELPVYADAETLDSIRQRFPYVLQGGPTNGVLFRPWLSIHEAAPRFTLGSMEIATWPQDHGYSQTLGYRFNDFAYTTDVIRLTEEAFAAIAGVKTWVIGTLTAHPNHLTHADVDLAIEWFNRIKPAHCVLSHLGVGLDYQTLKARLPAGMEPAYDAMVLTV